MTLKDIEMYLKYIGVRSATYIEADKLYLDASCYSDYEIVSKYFGKKNIPLKNGEVAIVIRDVKGNTITDQATAFMYSESDKKFIRIDEVDHFLDTKDNKIHNFNVRHIFDGMNTDDSIILDNYFKTNLNIMNGEVIVIRKVGYANVYMYDATDPKFILIGAYDKLNYNKMDGKLVAKTIKDSVKLCVDNMEKKPTLAIVHVGNDPASEIYMRGKKKDCDECGINCRIVSLDETASYDDIRNTLCNLSDDIDVDGIILQLPLPGKLNDEARYFFDFIDPEKDVDCFHPINVGKLHMGDQYILPCTPAGIIELIKYYNIDCDGKNCVIINRSDIVGKPLAALMTQRNATVTLCHSHTKNLADYTREADILITAVGIRNFITADMVKDGAVVIDVSMNREKDGKVKGDVDFENVAPKTSYITPVPGGVGPMTRAMLMQNTLNVALPHRKRIK